MDNLDIKDSERVTYGNIITQSVAQFRKGIPFNKQVFKWMFSSDYIGRQDLYIFDMPKYCQDNQIKLVGKTFKFLDTEYDIPDDVHFIKYVMYDKVVKYALSMNDEVEVRTGHRPVTKDDFEYQNETSKKYKSRFGVTDIHIDFWFGHSGTLNEMLMLYKDHPECIRLWHKHDPVTNEEE